MKYTIQDLAEGKCAVKNDGTLEELKKVIMRAFPEDRDVPKGTFQFYYASQKARSGWNCSSSTDMPYQSVKDFLEEEFVLPERWCIKRNPKNYMIVNEWMNKHHNVGKNDLSLYCDPSGYVNNVNTSKVDTGDKDGPFTEITFEQFKKHIMKQTSTRFPFKLTYENAKRIIDVACSNWKEKLSKEWGPQFLLNDYIGINEAFYKEMRNACNKQQNEVFDDIFGKDEIPCPYKDGELILVRYNENSEWQIRYSIGELNKHSEAGAYDSQKKSGLVNYWKFHAKLGDGNITLPQ